MSKRTEPTSDRPTQPFRAVPAAFSFEEYAAIVRASAEGFARDEAARQEATDRAAPTLPAPQVK